MATTLRAAISAAVKNDAERALKAINAAGINLSAEEATLLRAGNLSAFTDRQLAERFNAKVLGSLGIKAEEYAPLAASIFTKAKG